MTKKRIWILTMTVVLLMTMLCGCGENGASDVDSQGTFERKVTYGKISIVLNDAWYAASEVENNLEFRNINGDMILSVKLEGYGNDTNSVVSAIESVRRMYKGEEIVELDAGGLHYYQTAFVTKGEFPNRLIRMALCGDKILTVQVSSSEEEADFFENAKLAAILRSIEAAA